MEINEFFSHHPLSFTSQQMEAIRTIEGPVLLLAVPGSGKTTVLVTRLGYMIFCCQVSPERILTVTYTVAATQDLKNRFSAIFGDTMASRLEFRTINGICAKIIALYSRQIGRPAFELVTDEKRLATMVSQIYQQIQRDYPTENDLKTVRTLITYIKNRMLEEEEIRKLGEENELALYEIYQAYTSRLREQRLMDYDDQMVYAYNILRKDPRILQYYQELYPYLCVDEAQDTSRIQHAIIALLAGKNGNLFMVGDEDQSIYGFRAAYPQALLNFEKEHPGARVLLMEENFRSNARIVQAADLFIQKNTLRHQKQMRAVRKEGQSIRKLELKGRGGQYTYLVKIAADCKEQTAVLYRDNENVIPLVDLLEREGISYRIRNAELGFFSHRTVIDISNMIRFAHQPQNADLFLQIYYKMKTYLKKEQALRACEVSRVKKIGILDAALRYGHLDAASVKSVRAVKDQLEELKKDSGSMAIDRIESELGYGDYLKRAGIGNQKIFILWKLGQKEESGLGILKRLDYLKEILSSKENDPHCSFILSTIHASKGLEYDHVYLMDVADGLFPESVPKNLRKASREEIETYEEERRLFYVGATRARQTLTVFDFGMESTFTRQLLETGTSDPPSQSGRKAPALNTQQERYVSKNASKGRKKEERPLRSVPKRTVSDRKMPPKPHVSPEELWNYEQQLAVGMVVRHKAFGVGTIEDLEDHVMIIDFKDGPKRLSVEALCAGKLLRF